MEKQIKISLELAREIWEQQPKHNGDFKIIKQTNTIEKLLLENFTREELEFKKGLTWIDCFDSIGFIIDEDSDIVGVRSSNFEQNTRNLKNVFKTREQTKSALAFAQLSHIVCEYNKLNIAKSDVRFAICNNNGELWVKEININFNWFHLTFNYYDDCSTCLKSNIELWKDYWMI